jgi:5-formyltetrahydrofolate cyclo-ligase
MLRELGNPAVPVATTVHPLQVLERFPTESHDLPVSLIATPEELIEVRKPAAAPKGIEWNRLPPQALEEMPVLGALKRLLASRSKAARRRRARP